MCNDESPTTWSPIEIFFMSIVPVLFMIIHNKTDIFSLHLKSLLWNHQWRIACE
jgi:hypothetical protein